MATRTRKLYANREQSLLNGTSPNSGSGGDAHIPIRADGQSFRGLIRFGMNWSGVQRLIGARLFLKTTGGVHIGTSNWRSGSLRVSRLQGEFSSGGGSENYWATNAATTWPGPNSTDAIDRSWSTASGSWADRDITAILDQLLPSDRVSSTGGSGGGRNNNGLRLEARDGLVIEYWGLRSSAVPYIEITYDDTVDPTHEWEAPTNDDARLVPVTGTGPDETPSCALGGVLTAGSGDVIASARWELWRDNNSAGTLVDQGTLSLPAQGGRWTAQVSVGLEPGVEYSAYLFVETGSQGSKQYGRRFAFPLGRGTWAIYVGQDPENVGAAVLTVPEEIPTTSPRDGVVVYYARSADGTTPVTPWSTSVPSFPDGAWYLLVRALVWRRVGGYVGSPPEGIDRIVASWRGL